MLRRARRIKYTPRVRSAGRQKKNYADAPLCVAAGTAQTQRSCGRAYQDDASRGSAAARCDRAASLARSRSCAAVHATKRTPRVARRRGNAIAAHYARTHAAGRRDSCRRSRSSREPKQSVSTAHARICTRYARATSLIPELEPTPVYGSDRAYHATRTRPRAPRRADTPPAGAGRRA